MNKRGLSGVVTTVIIIAVSIAVIVTVSLVVTNLVQKGSNQVSLGKYLVDVDIEFAEIDFNTNIATVRIRRNIGEGNLVGLKFVFEDKKTAEVYERRFVRFDELAEKTFNINLTEKPSELIVNNTDKLSVAPIILLESGEEAIGPLSDSIGGLDEGAVGVQEEEEEDICYSNADCGTDYLMDGSKYCQNSKDVYQYKRVFSCTLGFCYDDIISVLIENCPYLCYDGNCIQESIQCTTETVNQSCGIDTLIGIPSCSQDGRNVVQDYKDYQCINSLCETIISLVTLETCALEEVCYQGECFIPLECVEHIDCDPGEVCEDGTCITEVPLNGGVINSIWPFGIGEYFDSANLPNPGVESYINKLISFPGSEQEGCLLITEHVIPDEPGAYAYVRLNVSVSNISNGDSYSILETDYLCNA